MTEFTGTALHGPTLRPELISRNLDLLAVKGLLNVLSLARYRGLSRILCFLNRHLPLDRKRTQVRLTGDTIFSYPTYDDYWSYFLLTDLPYEPEIASFLMRIKDLPYGFLDCGANFGYWSVLATSVRFGSHPAVSVEASAKTFALLEENAGLNNGRFACLKRAVSDSPGATIRFARHDHHGSRSIILPGQFSGQLYEEVETETIDSLIAAHMAPGQSVVCKLDVEGAEIPAFHGAEKALARDVIFVYEDHGKDDDCLPSDFLMGRNIEIYSLGADGTVCPVRSLDDIRAIKVNKRRGYNFVAVGGDGPLCTRVRALADNPATIPQA